FVPTMLEELRCATRQPGMRRRRSRGIAAIYGRIMDHRRPGRTETNINYSGTREVEDLATAHWARRQFAGLWLKCSRERRAAGTVVLWSVHFEPISNERQDTGWLLSPYLA